MSINSYQREMYKNHLEHAERRNHKYLYKIGDRYIYPEDVKGGGHQKHQVSADYKNFGTGFGDGTDKSKVINNASLDYGNKSKAQIKKAIATGDHSKTNEARANMSVAYALNRASRNTNYNHKGYDKNEDAVDSRIVSKANKDIRLNNAKIVSRQTEYKKSADEQARKRNTPGYHELTDKPLKRPQHLSGEIDKTRDRKKEKSKANSVEQQRKSAHAGYEEDRRNFPEGGSTEELERQKKKTKARKSSSKLGQRSGEVRTAFKSKSDYSKKSKEIDQINSAHRRATQKGDFEGDTPHKLLVNVNSTGDSGNLERQKRKTALRKRHKK